MLEEQVLNYMMVFGFIISVVGMIGLSLSMCERRYKGDKWNDQVVKENIYEKN